jgi:hypothetical protein
MTVQEFDTHFRRWVAAAVAEWNFPSPPEPYYAKTYNRLPAGLRTLLAQGIAEGLIIPLGWTFTLTGLDPSKGPYAWFSKYAAERRPNPNWEYFVQVAEFVRLHRVTSARGLTLAFEDHLMDLALYDGDRLLVCVEVKERARQVQQLVASIRKYEHGIDFQAPDRGNDPLRKAKYIVRRRPAYFCAVAIGAQLEYRVEYPDPQSFRFERDVIPW